MNRILVIGAAGMIGRKLLQKLAQGGSVGASRIAHATLHDVVAPQPPPGAPFQVRSVASDLSLEGEADKLVAERPGVIFHLAAVVSGEAEADFEKGYRVNLESAPATSRASSSPLRSPCSARRFPGRSATSSSARR